MKTKSLREAYGEALVEVGKKDKRVVVLDADLSVSTGTYIFAKEFPKRFFNMGIAEQNMVSTAVGLAIGGKIPFATSYAMFLVGRAWEQIRHAALCNLNVKFVSTHGGLSVGEDGPSHQALEDIALMRCVPNMTILSPADAFETKSLIKKVAKFRGPVYVRLCRPKLSIIYSKKCNCKIGRSTVLRKGKDIAIIATGIMVHEALKAADKLKEKFGISSYVVDMYSIKPIDEKTISKLAKETENIITCEDHNTIGGLGSAVTDVLIENSIECNLSKIGIKDRFAESGNFEKLFNKYGLSHDFIVSEARRLLKSK